MRIAAYTVAILTALAAPALGDAAADAAAIRGRLLGWAQAFNAREAAPVCDLFAEDLISVVPDAPDAGKREVCDHLALVLSREEIRLSYSVAIDEILVWGDHAAVRLDWTLTDAGVDPPATILERGIDLFRRDPDGAWRIIRFIAFAEDGERAARIDPQRAGQ
jgi:steroid delta-isomerase